MQANEDVARKLAQLTVKAGEQRAQIQDELTYMRSKPASAVKNIGVDAVKTMQALGLTNPKVVFHHRSIQLEPEQWLLIQGFQL